MSSDRTIYNKKWQEKNKQYSNYLKSRSTTRSFIKNKATNEDLEEIKGLINTREEILNAEDREEK